MLSSPVYIAAGIEYTDRENVSTYPNLDNFDKQTKTCSRCLGLGVHESSRLSYVKRVLLLALRVLTEIRDRVRAGGGVP